MALLVHQQPRSGHSGRPRICLSRGHRPQTSPLRRRVGSAPSTVYAGELFLPAYPMCEAHINDTPVEITFKVKQVSLDTALFPPERGGHTDVGACGKLF